MRDIKDPEFPNTLEDLGIISEEKITVSDDVVTVYFKPTITHCSLATMIGLLVDIMSFKFIVWTIEGGLG